MSNYSQAISKLDQLISYIDTYQSTATTGNKQENLRIPYATPLAAFRSSTPEKILFVTATRTKPEECSHSSHSPTTATAAASPTPSYTSKVEITDLDYSDFIAVVNVDPDSDKYCQIIDELPLGNDLELHHFGWNSCAGCLGSKKIKQRRFLIAPGFATGDVFIIDTTDYTKIKLHKKISGAYLRSKYGVSWPHTSHCLADGTVMMSFLGFDPDNAEMHANHPRDCEWLVFDGRDSSFNCLGNWIREGKQPKQKKSGQSSDDSKENGKHGANGKIEEKERHSYDFWYQPYHNIMISSGWGHPEAFSNGFNPNDVAKGRYGHSLYFWDWSQHKLIKTIEFDPSKVTMALETRFLHDPRSSHAFINGALSSNMIHCYLDTGKDGKGKEWVADDSYILIEAVSMKNWILPSMPGLITDILISMDDKYLYFANWLHGDVRQYDVSDPFKPKLTGQVFMGGLLRKDNPFGYECSDVNIQKKAFTPKIGKNKDKFIEGGPQMLQLSLDGRRLYVTNSLFSPFDKQFYPNLIKNGGMIVMCDIDHENGGIKLNTEFCVDFGKDTRSGVPARPHEMRYPGGDCTSDIFIDMEESGEQKHCCMCESSE